MNTSIPVTMMDNLVNDPHVPFVGPIPQALHPGYAIRIRGNVNRGATCFSVNLQDGALTMPRNDVALHFSPVFSSPSRVVRNSMRNGQWGPEESHGSYFPFSHGQTFEILILTGPNEFKIAVNGQHFTEFTHRLPLHMVTHLAIDGDVNLNSIMYDPSSSGSHSSMRGQAEITRPVGFIEPDNVFHDYPAPSEGYSIPVFPYPSSDPYPGSDPYPIQKGSNLYPPSPTQPGRSSPSSPYAPMPGSNPYGPPSPSHPYGPMPSSNPYGPTSPSNPYGPTSPSNPYRPTSPSNPYGPTSPSNPYGPPGGGYPAPPPPSPTSYPAQSHGGYSGPYPSQPGPYPGTSVVYPGQEGQKSGGGSSGLNTALAAGAAAVAGAAGAALMGNKHKGGKHGHSSFNPATALLGGGGHGGPAGMLAGGVGSFLGGGGSKHGPKHSGSSPIPIGGALAGGAAALAGAYMLSKSPIGKVLKPKKMKKLYKHKHKGKHGFKGFGSSSSSSSSSEEE